MTKYEKLVAKFGTNFITKNGKLDIDVIARTAIFASKIYAAGKIPVFVSSGAVALGMEWNGLTKRPTDVEELQDLSAEGARGLNNIFQDVFANHGLRALYIPVTGHSFKTEKERENIERIIDRSGTERYGKRSVTIWNGNDALLSDELVRDAGYPAGYSDNDHLAVELAKCCKASKCLFFTRPGKMGTGGRESKNKAIEHAKRYGITVKVGTTIMFNELETLLL